MTVAQLQIVMARLLVVWLDVHDVEALSLFGVEKEAKTTVRFEVVHDKLKSL